jgi:hypothetical protein
LLFLVPFLPYMPFTAKNSIKSISALLGIGDPGDPGLIAVSLFVGFFGIVFFSGLDLVVITQIMAFAFFELPGLF